jgi:hypothetical protein
MGPFDPLLSNLWIHICLANRFLSILELICGRLTFHNRGRRTEQAMIDRHVLGQRDMPTWLLPLLCVYRRPHHHPYLPTLTTLFRHPIWLASKLIKKAFAHIPIL